MEKLISERKKRRISKRFNKEFNMIDTNCQICNRLMCINKTDKTICSDHR